jgi:hypothetical protein
MKANVSKLEEFSKRIADKNLFKRALSASLYDAISDVGEYARQNHRFKSRTGVLAGSIDVSASGLKASILLNTNKAPYGAYVYDGWIRNKPILPVDKKALSFVIGNRRIFANSITKPAKWNADPFIENAWKAKESSFIKSIEIDVTEQLEAVL